jgi:hypothetical protein
MEKDSDMNNVYTVTTIRRLTLGNSHEQTIDQIILKDSPIQQLDRIILGDNPKHPVEYAIDRRDKLTLELMMSTNNIVAPLRDTSRRQTIDNLIDLYERVGPELNRYDINTCRNPPFNLNFLNNELE